MARPFDQASGKVKGEKSPAESQVGIAGFNGDGVNSTRKAEGLSARGACGPQVENGTRSQNIAFCFEMNALGWQVNDEVEIARFDVIEFENEGVPVVLAREFVLTKSRSLPKEQTDQ